MVPDSALLYLLCLLVKHSIANTAKFSIVRQKSIVNTGSKLWDGLVQSKTIRSSQCFKDPQCLVGHFHPVSKRCSLYSSDALVCNPSEDGMILIIDREKGPVLDDCSAHSETGVVTIQGIGPVYCENTKHGGGWTVFQRRFDGSVDFNRDWENYKLGFGDMNGEFWLGLEKLHRLTDSGDYMMRVDLQDYENNAAYAIYSCFRIGNESMAYKLYIDGYSGTAGNGMANLNKNKFSTIDLDNDQRSDFDCGDTYKGGWWYTNTNCGNCKLNSPYGQEYTSYGITWYSWKSNWHHLKATSMMIRRI